MANHRLDAAPETVHWGFFDAALKPLLTVESGDTVTISTVSGMASQMPAAPLAVPPALAAIHKSVQQKLPGSHLHRAGRREGRQGRPGAGSAHQGHPAPLRLGLQHDPPARRRAAGRLRHADADPHPARQTEEHRHAAVGARAAAGAVLRRDGGRAAAGLGHDLDAAAAPQRRQSRQQGAGGGHDALSADPSRRRAVLGRRRPRRAGRRRGLRHRDRDRADRHVRAASCATT